MKSRFRFLLLAAVITTVVLGGLGWWYLRGPRRTPPGQPPIVHLTSGNLDVLRDAFNAAIAGPRLLVLASPT